MYDTSYQLAYNNYSELTGQSSLDADMEPTKKQDDTLPQTDKQQDGEISNNEMVYTCLHTPDDDDSPPRMKMKKVNPFMLVYNFTYYVYLWYSALCITLKGVWAITSQK